MKTKIISLLVLALAGLFLTGCVSKRLARLEKVAPDEAIVVGKFRIIYNGEDVTKGSALLYRPIPCSLTQKTCYGDSLDTSGYLFMRVPVGRNRIAEILHRSGFMQHNFGAEELTFEAVGGGVINYVGDVTFDWNGMNSGSGFALATASFLLNTFATGGRLAVSVESKPAEAQELFRKKFSTDRSLIPTLLVSHGKGGLILGTNSSPPAKP